MIKLTASVSRKVPVPNLEFSSQSFHGGVEVEVSDGATEEQIRERLGQLYALLDSAVQAEIAKAEAAAVQPAPAQNATQPRWGGGNGQPQPKPNGNGRRASQAQIKAIFAIAKSAGMDRQSLLARIAQEFNVPDPDSLTITQASTLIQSMKGNNGHQ